MAQEFGELSDFIDGGGIAFSFNGERFEIDPTAHDVLQFQKNYRNLATESKLSGENMLKLGAKLSGGDLNLETLEFEGGVAAELVNKGASFEQVNRLMLTIVTKYWFNDDAATEYYQTGDMGKALGLKQEKRKTGRKSQKTD